MRVCLGIPVLGDQPGEVIHSHLSLAASMGSVCQLVVPKVRDVSPHARAREVILQAAFENECDYLLFVDADMEVRDPRSFGMLLETMRSTDAVMVAGHCRKRGFPFTPTWFKRIEIDGQERYHVCTAQGIVELDSTGLAFNLINMRWVKANIESPVFLQGRLDGKEYVWEDGWFCKRIRDKGGKIVGDGRVRIDHLGPSIMVNDETCDILTKLWMQEHPEGLDQCQT